MAPIIGADRRVNRTIELVAVPLTVLQWAEMETTLQMICLVGVWLEPAGLSPEPDHLLACIQLMRQCIVPDSVSDSVPADTRHVHRSPLVVTLVGFVLLPVVRAHLHRHLNRLPIAHIASIVPGPLSTVNCRSLMSFRQVTDHPGCHH